MQVGGRMDGEISKTRRPPHPDLTVGLEAFLSPPPAESRPRRGHGIAVPHPDHPRRSFAGNPPRSEGRGELTLTPLRGVRALRSDSPGRSRSPSPLRESPALHSPPLLL